MNHTPNAPAGLANAANALSAHFDDDRSLAQVHADEAITKANRAALANILLSEDLPVDATVETLNWADEPNEDGTYDIIITEAYNGDGTQLAEMVSESVTAGRLDGGTDWDIFEVDGQPGTLSVAKVYAWVTEQAQALRDSDATSPPSVRVFQDPVTGDYIRENGKPGYACTFCGNGYATQETALDRDAHACTSDTPDGDEVAPRTVSITAAAEAEVMELARDAQRAADGDSNDTEIDALREALEAALSLIGQTLPDIDEDADGDGDED